jgi:hypothetical protein
MSQTLSPFMGQPYSLECVCRVCRLARLTVYWPRQERPRSGTRLGPIGADTDGALGSHIHTILGASPFPGEAYRKVWTGLRYAELHTLPPWVLRVMRGQDLLVPHRQGHPYGPKAHDGVIHRTRLYHGGTDMTSMWMPQNEQMAFLSRWIVVRPCVSASMSPSTGCDSRSGRDKQKSAQEGLTMAAA